MAIAAVTVIITFQALTNTIPRAGLIYDYGGLALTIVTGLIMDALRRRGRVNPAVTLLFLVTDQALITLALYLTGGPENFWWFLPVVLIFIAGYLFNRSIVLLLTLLASLAICLDFGLEYFGLIPHFHMSYSPLEYWHNPMYLFDYLFAMITLYSLGALISSYFSRVMGQTTAQLQHNLQASETNRREVESSRKALLNIMEDLDNARTKLEQKVKERTQELEQIKIELEQKVKERTLDLEESRKAILHMMKDLKEDISKMQALDRMKTEFLSMVSHELRTPLTPIKGYLSLLTSGKMGEVTPAQSKALAVLTRQSEHLHSLIDSILDLSRIELGKPIPLSKEPLAMPTVIEETVEAMKIQAAEKQVRITTEIEPNLPTASGDVIKLKRVLANLVGNALKFSPEQGEISITARRVGNALQVEVRDQGVGVSADSIPHLFEKFYQVDSSITRAAGGMGMGLPIAKELVELHGGRIWIESAGLGLGTTAIFTLPVV
ncbi:MAG: ATP-binding protein [Candidatus Margulisbacteria bacterium]|nr:ATP-binding protein [Candidatus Margulisiibacteriota bacterium]